MSTYGLLTNNQGIIDDFTSETGIEVIASTYISNEEMFAHLKDETSNSYDLVMPSTYYIKKMVKNLIQPIEQSKIEPLRI